MIIDGEVHILSNHHEINGAKKITIKMTSVENSAANPKTSLAVLKIKGFKDIPQLKFGVSDKLLVGEWGRYPSKIPAARSRR